MKDRRRKIAAADLVHRGIVVVPDPDPDDEIRGHPDEPGIAVILRRPGLAAHRDVGDAGRLAGAAVDHRLQRVEHHRAAVARQGRAGLRLRPEVEWLRRAAPDRVDAVALKAGTVGEHARIGAGHLEEGHLGRAQREARQVRQFRLHPEPARRLDHSGNADLVGDLGRDRVDGQGEGAAQGDGAPEAVVGVLRLPFADLDRAVDQHRLRRVALLVGGEVDEQLEQRAGLALGLRRPVELAVLVVAPAHHRQHRALLREHHHRGLRDLLLGTFRVEAAGDDTLGEALEIEVEGGAQGDVAGGVDEPFGVGRHHVDEEVGAGRRLGRRSQGDGLGPRRIGRGRGDRPRLDHGLQHHVGALLGAAEIAGRRQLRGRAHEASEHRGFRQGQGLGRLAEIAPRGGIDPVGAGAEIGGVEVAEQDLLLRHRALGAERQERLLHLAPQGLLLGQGGEADVLLGDGRGAFAHPAAREVAPDGAGEAARIDAPMGIEAPVLDGDDRLCEMRRQVGRHEPLPLEDAAGGEDPPVIGLHGDRPAIVLGRDAAQRR